MDRLFLDRELRTETQCARFLERLRWPKGVQCLRCGAAAASFHSQEAAHKKEDGAIRRVPSRRLFQCGDGSCAYQFGLVTGTLLHGSHIPLQKWLFAVAV